MVDVTGAEISVPPQLQDLPLQIQNTSAQIEDLLQTLNSQLMALQGFWQGQAADGHTTVQQNWHNAETNLLGEVGVLGNLGRTTQINWDNYVSGENANTQSWAMG
jgi:WXG100 family type VII secretion target